MKKIAVLVAVALGLVISATGDASADQSGDEGFCLGGWGPTFAVTIDLISGEIGFYQDGGVICHMGDTNVVVSGG